MNVSSIRAVIALAVLWLMVVGLPLALWRGFWAATWVPLGMLLVGLPLLFLLRNPAGRRDRQE